MGCVSRGIVVPIEGVSVPGYEVSDLFRSLFPAFEVSKWFGVLLPVYDVSQVFGVAGSPCPGGYVSELCEGSLF